MIVKAAAQSVVARLTHLLRKQNKMKISIHIFIARLIVALASAFALWEYPEYWFVSGPMLLFAVMFGGMIEGFFVAKDKAENDTEK